MTEEQCQKVSMDIPGLVFDVPPKIVLRCVPLDRYTKSPYLSGAILTAKIIENHDTLNLKIGNQSVEAKVSIRLKLNNARDTLSIQISLDFPEEFKNYIKLINQKCHSRTYFSQDLYQSLRQRYEGDPEQERLQAEILHAIMHQHSNDPDWKRYTCSNFPGLSMRFLNQRIKETERRYQEITRESLPNKNELRMLREFQQYHDKEILICKLHDYEWYNKYFCNIYDNVH